MPTEQQMVTLEEAKEQVRIVSEMLGRLHIAFARTIVDEMGEGKGKTLVLKAVREFARLNTHRAKEELLAEGREPTFDDRRSKNRFKYYGMLERREQLTVEGVPGSRAYGCAMGSIWSELREGELGHLYFYVDAFAAMAFDPQYKVYHTKLLCPDGYCEMVRRKTTEPERRAFASEDGELEDLDRHL